MILQPFDMEMGAGTFHPATTLRALGPKPWCAAYVQPSRRPTDGRYGENPMRLQHYYQFQAILKPSPPDILERYLGSLEAIGIDTSPARHPLRRGRLGEPDARRLGPRLGSVVRRLGGQPVHLFPAGRRHRGRAGVGRDHLRAGTAGHVPVRQEVGLRPAVQPHRLRGAAELRRRLPAERAGAVDLQFRGRRHRDAVPPLRRCREGVRPADRAEAAAAGLRAVHKGVALLQPAGRARRDQRHRAAELHPARARARQGVLRGVARHADSEACA